MIRIKENKNMYPLRLRISLPKRLKMGYDDSECAICYGKHKGNVSATGYGDVCLQCVSFLFQDEDAFITRRYGDCWKDWMKFHYLPRSDYDRNVTCVLCSDDDLKIWFEVPMCSKCSGCPDSDSDDD
jgi:hypothetical protein